MKSNFIRILVAVIRLSNTMCKRISNQNNEDTTPKSESEEEVISQHSFKGNYDWEQHMVIADRKRDDAGMLLPLQSYEKTIERVKELNMGKDSVR